MNIIQDEEILVTYRPAECGTYSAELKEDIVSPKQFSMIVQVMEEMKEDDTFVLHISSNGGSIDAGDSLLHAINKCKGHVHMVATGGVHSMATAILLSAHSFELSDNFSALIHSGSMGYGSDFSEYKQYSEFSVKAHERFMRRTYEGFLTEEEIESVINGKPIVLDAEHWMERSEQRNKYFMLKNPELQEMLENVEPK